MSTPGPVDGGDVVELLSRMVSIPSVSGSEQQLVGFLAAQMRHFGLETFVSGRNTWCRVEGKRPGSRTLLLQAHCDTVPAGETWTVDPWRAKRLPPPEDAPEVGERLQGLGSNDTKGGGAAMLEVVRRMSEDRDFAGTLLYAATCDEETGGEGLEVLRPELPPITAAVIAEPTQLRVATAQRGLMRIVVRCEGQSAHASRPWQGVNAIELAIADIERLRAIPAPELHPLLGKSTLTVTMIDGGVRSNVLPPVCRFTLDGRPTPTYPNEWWLDRIREVVEGELEVVRARMTPVETPEDDPLVSAALAATETDEPIPFGGVSDLFHVRDVPGIVLGPGLPTQSHQADEWVPLDQVRRAVDVYEALAREYLR